MRESRKMGATCNFPTCKRWQNRHCNTISEDQRENLFNEFWKEMNWDSKKMFVCTTVETVETKQKTVEGGSSRRGSSFFLLSTYKRKQSTSMSANVSQYIRVK